MKFKIELPDGIELPKFGYLRNAKPAEEEHGCKNNCPHDCKEGCHDPEKKKEPQSWVTRGGFGGIGYRVSDAVNILIPGNSIDGHSTTAVIADLIERTRAEALKDHPQEKFNSLHEAYAVLLEEVEEAEEEMDWIDENRANLWEAVRFDEFDESKSSFETIYGAGINAILELLQVCAVCRKALESGLWQ